MFSRFDDASRASACGDLAKRRRRRRRRHQPTGLQAITKAQAGEPISGKCPDCHGLAEQLGIAPDRIHIVSPYIGGPFGSSGSLTGRTALIAHPRARGQAGDAQACAGVLAGNRLTIANREARGACRSQAPREK